MQISPRERRWTPPSPEERARLEAEAARWRDELAARREALRPLREAVLRAGPKLRDLPAALECPCGCHPSPGSPELHDHGAACPCQHSSEERRRALEEMLSALSEVGGGEDLGAELAEVAGRLGVELRLESWGAPLVIAGVVDGRGCFLRERHGSFQVEVAPDEDPGRDVWRAPPEELSLVILEGSEEQLQPKPGEHFIQRSAEVLVGAVRSFLTQRTCSHEGMRRYCPECGVAATEVEAAR